MELHQRLVDIDIVLFSKEMASKLVVPFFYVPILYTFTELINFSFIPFSIVGIHLIVHFLPSLIALHGASCM